MGVPPPSSSTNIFNSRPLLLSADSRRLSYKSKSGRVLTLEMRSSRAGVPTLASLKAASQQQQQQDASASVQSHALRTQQQKQLSAAANAKSGPAAQADALVAEANSDGTAGLWPDLFDTLSFWCMEAVEIACFGPYEEPAQLIDALDAYADSIAATPAVEHPPALTSSSGSHSPPTTTQSSVHAGLLPPTTAQETAAK